jgi:NLR family CARD domain-containing protein 3
MKVKDNCWICEGWTECKFEFRSQIFGGEVYLHIAFDGYQPDLMLQSSAGMYQTYRMIPPGVHRYFFSFNGEYNINPNAPKVSLDDETFAHT